LANDNFSLVGGFSGILTRPLDTNGHSINESEGATVTAVATPNIWAGDGDTLHITGSTQIDDFTDAPRIGARVTLIFDNAPLVSDGMGITLQGGIGFQASPGDRLHVYAEAINAFYGIIDRNNGVQALGTPLGIWNQKVADTVTGGTATAGSAQTRVLNNEKFNNITGASLSSNQITLPVGTYDIEAKAPAYKVGEHQAQLFNITLAGIAVEGSTEFSSTADDVQTNSLVWDRLVFTTITVLELRHNVQTTRMGDGFGQGDSANFGTSNIYSEVRVRQVS